MKDIFIFQEKKRLLLNEWYLTTKHDVQSLYKNMSDLLAIAQLVLWTKQNILEKSQKQGS